MVSKLIRRYVVPNCYALAKDSRQYQYQEGVIPISYENTLASAADLCG